MSSQPLWTGESLDCNGSRMEQRRRAKAGSLVHKETRLQEVRCKRVGDVKGEIRCTTGAGSADRTGKEGDVRLGKEQH